MRMAVYNRAGWAIAAYLCVLAGCGTAPVAKKADVPDPTREAWYGNAVKELAAVSRDATQAYAQGKPDRASTLIEQGEGIARRLLAVPRPTIAAAEAASDLDDLYARMLFGNRHYGWARLQFQKNLARWKHWVPKTDEVDARLKIAEKGIADCDRKIEAP